MTILVLLLASHTNFRRRMPTIAVLDKMKKAVAIRVVQPAKIIMLF